jgi:hypothetical protein
MLSNRDLKVHVPNTARGPCAYLTGQELPSLPRTDMHISRGQRLPAARTRVCTRKPWLPARIDHADERTIATTIGHCSSPRGEEVLAALGPSLAGDAAPHGEPASLAGRPAHGVSHRAQSENLQSASHAGTNAATPKGSLCRRWPPRFGRPNTVIRPTHSISYRSPIPFASIRERDRQVVQSQTSGSVVASERTHEAGVSLPMLLTPRKRHLRDFEYLVLIRNL